MLLALILPHAEPVKHLLLMPSNVPDFFDMQIWPSPCTSSCNRLSRWPCYPICRAPALFTRVDVSLRAYQGAMRRTKSDPSQLPQMKV